MTIHQAAAYWVPAGEFRGRPLACVALDHPDYLVRLAEDGAPECPRGGQFHGAVCLVVEQLRRVAEADILAGRTLDPAAFRPGGGTPAGGEKGAKPKAGNRNRDRDQARQQQTFALGGEAAASILIERELQGGDTP